jgi:glycosyltransferase involved in cell wall biosynthesis
VKILHVIAGPLQRGGIETWLLGILRRRTGIQMDIACAPGGALEPEARDLGAAVYHPQLSPQWRWAERIALALEDGRYDVLHAHCYARSGLIMHAARDAVAVRIAHSHNVHAVRSAKALWHGIMRWLIGRYATHRLAVSETAGRALFGRHSFKMMPLGIDVEGFRSALAERAVARAELGIPRDALVIGHVGRFVLQKNHACLLAAFRHLADRMHAARPARLLLVGDGPLRAVYESKSDPRVIFAGARGDVPRVMAAMDVLTLPSLHEGLGLVVLEAQAQGLPCVVSEYVPHEARASDLVEFVPLGDGPSGWGERLLTAAQHPRRPVDMSAWTLEASAERLLTFYEQALRDVR